MTELLEKMSYNKRLEGLKDELAIHAGKPEAILELICNAVELAYKAGMLHFNALDHTLLSTVDLENSMVDNFDRNEISRVPWILGSDWDPMGPVKQDLLISLYLQEKGFK